MVRKAIIILVLTCPLFLIQSSCANQQLIIDKQRSEIRCAAVVQRTDAPRMDDFAKTVPALMGSKGGKFEKYFVFLTDACVKDIHDGLLVLGARSRVVYKVDEAAKHKGLRQDTLPEDYMQGDPVQIYIEWEAKGKTICMAYEDFFIEQINVGTAKIQKPWTPHFVFHGSGVLNNKKTGCIACTHDCLGGIIGNNQYPLDEPIPVLKADWRKLPKPGTGVTVVLRPVPSKK